MSGRMHTVESLRARITGDLLDGGYMTRNVPHVECVDGFTVSVQASEAHCCDPRENRADWTSVEMGCPSVAIPDFCEWREWRNGDDSNEGAVFGYVPIERVVELINAHGGEVAK